MNRITDKHRKSTRKNLPQKKSLLMQNSIEIPTLSTYYAVEMIYKYCMYN